MREIFTSDSSNIKILNGSCHCVPGIPKLNKEVVIVCLEAFHHGVVLHLTCHLDHLSQPDNGGLSGIRSHWCLCTLREIAAHSWTQVTIASLAWLYRGRGWEISARGVCYLPALAVWIRGHSQAAHLLPATCHIRCQKACWLSFFLLIFIFKCFY